VRELGIWWPEHPEIGIISYGRGRTKGLSKKKLAAKDAALAAPIQIVSYDLAAEVDPTPWDVIIIDEIHKLKSPWTKQSRAVKRLTLGNPGAAIIGLTGTPMPDRPIDIWNPLDTIWPARFGSAKNDDAIPWAFKDRYSNKTHNGHGWDFEGVNVLHLEELRRRLAACTTRVTKAEVAHFLPKLLVVPLLVDPVNLKATKLRSASKKGFEDSLFKSGDEKVGPAYDWAETCLENGAKKLVVFTYLKETARRIEEKCKKLGVPTFVITGDIVADDRHAVITQFGAVPKAICVATMSSAGIGINGLEIATDVLFAELYYRPETVEQALGRFNRLSSKEPTTVSLLVLRGTLDEALVVSLQQKLEAIDSVITPSQGAQGLETASLADDASEDAFIASLAEFVDSDIDVP
jgi:SWI/SNF-related matrix-associated actin-dependent regulator 1 of chromatin subfamily A